MSKTKKQVMNFITKDRMRRFPDECGKSTLAKFLHSYFPEKVVDSLLASFESIAIGTENNLLLL